MAEWITPVFDRTQSDVDFAKQKIAEWILADITGNPIVVYDLKGCVNTRDLNRIEGNIKYLADKFTQYQYSTDTSSKSWKDSGLPTDRDVSRILYNVKSLLEVYHLDTERSVPMDMSQYYEINTIENNLSTIKKLLDCMVNSFKKCGTYQSGGKPFLPIRR